MENIDIKKDLEFIKNHQKDILLLSQISGVLDWDKETYMPDKAVDNRAEQMSLLSGMIHEKLVSDEFYAVLHRLKETSLEHKENLLVTRILKDVEKAKKIPKEFVEELTKAQIVSTNKWREAKEKKDFKIFQPFLERVLELTKKKAAMINLPGHSYNSLLDDYEEGMTVEELKPKFEALKSGLLIILNKIKKSEKYKNQKIEILNQKFAKDIQMELVRDVVKRIGLTEDVARIDFSAHPFSTRLGSKDIRITTALRETPLFAFSSSIHEAGHGLYSLNFPEEHEFNFLGYEPSTGIHESQSRFWENMVGLSKSFWKYYFKKFKDKFSLEGDFEKWYEEANFVEPSLIRIESDEVHYCLHIILRFELELGLIEGNVKVSELPQIWNRKMKEYFDIVPENDSAGVLQDVHWGYGYFGYFPTYALGTIYAAQIYEQLVKEIPWIEEEVERGEYAVIRSWLRSRVHKHGRKYSAEELIKQICRDGINTEVYLNYLNKKYGEIYGF